MDLVANYTRAGLGRHRWLPPGPNPFTGAFRSADRSAQPAVGARRDCSPSSERSRRKPARPRCWWAATASRSSNLWDGNFPTTEVQLRISLPIRNRTAEANLSKSLAETRRIHNQTRADRTEHPIRRAHRHASCPDRRKLRLQAARVARESAEEQYQSEQRQFRAGTSTLFLVQQRQATMITARSQERRAEADLAKPSLLSSSPRPPSFGSTTSI